MDEHLTPRLLSAPPNSGDTDLLLEHVRAIQDVDADVQASNRGTGGSARA